MVGCIALIFCQPSLAANWADLQPEHNSHAAAAAKSLQSYLTLWDPIDGSPPGSSVPGILQARILEWVAISRSNAWKWKVKMKSLSRVWLFATPWTVSLPGPSVHGIFQASVLEWVAIYFSNNSHTSSLWLLSVLMAQGIWFKWVGC